MSRFSKAQRWMLVIAAIGFFFVLAGFVYNVPFVNDRLAWRVSELRTRIKYAINPPQDAVFTPNPTLVAMVNATLTSVAPSPTPTASEGPTATPQASATPTLIPTAIPQSIFLNGIRHEYQGWNNCGPATLAMTLSFWGWQGGQGPVASYVKPNGRDKNVMPYELAEYVESQTDLQAVARVGGDLELLKRLLAAGFPVMIEKGFEGGSFEGWMGHYQLLAGYDDNLGRFQAYDSFEGDFSNGQTLPVAYDTVAAYWPAFNYTFLVIYEPGREAELMNLLGPLADEETSYREAATRASNEIFATSGRDQFFRWFNRGTSLVNLRDYAGAAAAYDEAFAIYAGLDPDTRPWRMLWYQTGPYFAYFYSGRYSDVISLSTQTLSNMSEPVLEESYYWRALALEASGDLNAAIADLRTSLQHHPGFAPSLAALERMGVAP